MPNYARIKCAYWDDPDIVCLSAHAKLVYLWTFTNRACGIAGVFRVGLDVARQAVGLARADFERAWEELVACGKIHFDPVTSTTWVVGKLKQEALTGSGNEPSAKLLAGAVRELWEIPNGVVLDAFRQRYGRTLSEVPAFERFIEERTEPHAYPIDGVPGSRPPIPIPIPILNNIPNNNPQPARPRGEGRRRRRVAEYAEGFQRWFAAYPKHRRKQKFEAFEVWTADDLEGRLEELLAVLAAQAASLDWTKDDGKWVPYPHRYLAKRRYEDGVGADAAPTDCVRCHEPAEVGQSLCRNCATNHAPELREGTQP